MKTHGAARQKQEAPRLFPAGLSTREWVEFQAEGFSSRVCGVIFKTGDRLSCGMPLGGVDTGCVDLELDGTFGYCTVFNSHRPRRGKLGEPFLGISVGGQTWVLTTASVPGLTDHPKIKTVSRIEYWGHYPMADLEFETDAPVAVGLRAWSPFVPGNAAISNTPAAVFEVHLRNWTDLPRRGAIAMTFPGPVVNETLGETVFHRTPDMGACTGGAHIYNDAGIGYALGYVAPKAGKMPVARMGAHLGNHAAEWAAIETELPSSAYAFAPEERALGSSVAIDFKLEPGECKVILITEDSLWAQAKPPIGDWCRKEDGLFAMSLRPEWGPAGIVSMPSGDMDTTGFEYCEWFGMSGYVGGIHLVNLQIAQRMAESVGDKEFAARCETWLEEGSRAMEEKLWTGKHYLANYDPLTGRKTDAVFAYQTEGDWFAFQHGLKPIFRPDRLTTVLDTIRTACVPSSQYGVANFVNADGTPAAESVYKICEGKDHFFVPLLLILAMTYMHKGEKEFGLELARRCMHNICCRQGLAWDAPNVIRGDTGEAAYGRDYYQNMIIWSVPIALNRADLSSTRQPGGLVDRVLRVGSGHL